MNGTIDKIAWICLRDGKILGARSHGKDAYYVPGGKREPGETDRDRVSPANQAVFDHLHHAGRLSWS